MTLAKVWRAATLMLSMLDGSHGRRSRSPGAFSLLGGFGGFLACTAEIVLDILDP